MNDDIIASISGTIASLLGMLLGVINIQVIYEVFLFGLIGGVAGYLGKLLVNKAIRIIKKTNEKNK